MRKIWLDTETSGLSKEDDQVLTLAYIVDDSSGNEIERREISVKLKDGIIPTPKAISINKLRPLNSEYVKNAITESELINELINLGEKHTVSGVKPQFVAYNADFDKDFVATAMSRNGKSFNDVFNKSVIDPMKTVKSLIAAKKLKTRDNGYGKSSAALGAVAEALNVKFEGMAHSALADVDVMRKITPTLHKMATGQNFYDSSGDPSNFIIGKVYHVTTVSKSSGAKTRHIKVLKNDHDNQTVIALDEDDLRKNGFKPSAIRTFNYDTIQKELEPVSSDVSYLERIYEERESEISDLIKSPPQNTKLANKLAKKPVFKDESKDFSLIRSVASKMLHADNKKEAYYKIKEELTKSMGDSNSAAAVLTKAERLSQSLGFKSWSKEIFEEDKVQMLSFEGDTAIMRVVLHPSGLYKVAYKSGNKTEIRDFKNKKDLIKNFSNKDETGKLISFIESLPDNDLFKNSRHPIILEEEFKGVLDYLKIYKEDNDARLAIGELLLLLKNDYPKNFDKFKNILSVDEVKNVDLENYYKLTSKDSEEFVAHDSSEVEDREKLRSKCQMCGRSLGSHQTIYGMGPVCRSKSETIELSNEPLDTFVEKFETPNSDNIVPDGSINVLKVKNDEGKNEDLIYAEKICDDDLNLTVIDRRAIKQMGANGEDPIVSSYLAMHIIPKDSILGVGKIKTDGDPEVVSKEKTGDESE